MIGDRRVIERIDRLHRDTGAGMFYLAVQIALLNSKLNTLIEQEGTEMANLEALTAEVAANTDATLSVVTLVDRLADELEAAQNDPAQVQALVDELRANNQSIAAAVSANTPSEGGGGETPEPV